MQCLPPSRDSSHCAFDVALHSWFFFTDFVYMYALITELYCQVCRLQLCKLLLLYTVTYLWDLRTNIKICVCHVHYRQTTRTQHVLTMCGVGEQVIRR